MDILDRVSREPDGYTVIQLAQHLQLKRATCSTIVQSLVEGGYLLKIQKTKNYVLGPRVYGLTRRRYFLHHLVIPAKPHTDALSMDSGCPAVLAALFQNHYYKIYTARPELGTPPEEDVVQIENIGDMATGLVLLAYASPETRGAFFQANPRTLDNWRHEQPPQDRLAAVHNEGAAVTRDVDYTGVAVPLNGRYQTAALGLYMPSDAVTENDLGVYISSLKKTATVISREYSKYQVS